MEDLQYMRTMTGCQDEILLAALLETAESELLALTNRTTLIDRLKPAKRKWALIAYNRMGTEGETSRSGGGISASFVEIPAEIKSVVEQCRIARVGGHAYEKEPNENIPAP